MHFDVVSSMSICCSCCSCLSFCFACNTFNLPLSIGDKRYDGLLGEEEDDENDDDDDLDLVAYLLFG